uniref:Spaetzle domain-containing protein n=1 Tax=Cuerna arida TaxID=1464854 RepID=A0A1B6ENK1_9HEMI
MAVLLFLVGLTVLLPPAQSTPPPLPPSPYHCLEYGNCRHHYNLVPAPPGKTPPCASHGSTFCENTDQYPMRLIQYLVDHWVYDYRSLLKDESKDDFPKRPRPQPTYGPPHPVGYKQFLMSDAYHTIKYNPPVHVPGNSLNFSQPQGYPDRRYPLPPLPFYNNDPGQIYSALLQPSNVTPYDPSHWWKRITRSDETSRPKRQLPGQDIQLCPTRSQFVSPRAALNSQGNWMYVVNLEQDQTRLTQQVRAETCTSDRCNGICTLPNGYTSRCQQQYVQKRLIALEGSGNQLYTDTFWLPHCCICQITPTN